ncbi:MULTISPECIES: DUF1995 family protein [unclassified Thermosynechococcus]|uniref:DUF1995 family protein n=1 Tax=unclassified Thermosynechococcus TaxID=2622553 RepID=UPI0026715768|nr:MULTISPECIES: DUF1995 family protein [unclassified Thermosynechococcus]MDR5639023.1 DUF1995 family protein [Thermosynechococcus sp. PP42]WKT80374.1 DUF1995 family protein [Thermosynechococcus sp. PP45]WNC23984.1 DUF1995 family protein [Thermosynechococcus sp. PP551]WNC26562.1 DUF1995 family protein [Thermosynechococcus sp. PP555]WNC29123.1 DUF1995 family protein [Thermosynechococcus sp. PKX82]
MSILPPDSLETALSQAQQATQAALQEGKNRLQIEILLPDLNAMAFAAGYLPLFEELGRDLKVFFADAGSAALARREWGETAYSVRGVNELLTPITASDRAIVIVAPTPVEANAIEQMCETAGDRPFILLNPRLQDVAVVGIGYAGRRLRERFLNTLEPCYYLRPLAETIILWRCYPQPWQIWQYGETAPTCLAEFEQRPSSEDIERALTPQGKPRGQGVFSRLSAFLRALQN